MVNRPISRHKCRAMTIVEVIVTSVLMGVVFTGMLATMTMTMKRMTSTAQKENDEKQMDRFQVEMAYFISRSSKVEIQDSAGNPAQEGNILVCTLQYDPLELTSIQSIRFSLGASPHNVARRSLTSTIETASDETLSYTYSGDLESNGSSPMFTWNSSGFVEYRWSLDSGYGTESFNNMAAPPSSL